MSLDSDQDQPFEPKPLRLLDPLDVWLLALQSPIGIVVYSDQLGRAQNKLYAARAESGDPRLLGLSLVVSPVAPNELWVIHNGRDQPSPESDA